MVTHQVSPRVPLSHSGCEFSGDLLVIPRRNIEAIPPNNIGHLFVTLAQPFSIRPTIVFSDDFLNFDKSPSRASASLENHQDTLLLSHLDYTVNILEILVIRSGGVVV